MVRVEGSEETTHRVVREVFGESVPHFEPPRSLANLTLQNRDVAEGSESFHHLEAGGLDELLELFHRVLMDMIVRLLSVEDGRGEEKRAVVVQEFEGRLEKLLPMGGLHVLDDFETSDDVESAVFLFQRLPRLDEVEVEVVPPPPAVTYLPRAVVQVDANVNPRSAGGTANEKVWQRRFLTAANLQDSRGVLLAVLPVVAGDELRYPRPSKEVCRVIPMEVLACPLLMELGHIEITVISPSFFWHRVLLGGVYGEYFLPRRGANVNHV